MLDYVYTNVTNKNTSSSVSLFEISDHLSIFFLLRHSKHNIRNLKKYNTCMKNFTLKESLTELYDKLPNIDIETYSANISYNVNSLIAIFKNVLVRHAHCVQCRKKSNKK